MPVCVSENNALSQIVESAGGCSGAHARVAGTKVDVENGGGDSKSERFTVPTIAVRLSQIIWSNEVKLMVMFCVKTAPSSTTQEYIQNESAPKLNPSPKILILEENPDHPNVVEFKIIG